MSALSANTLETRRTSAIAEVLIEASEAIVAMRGKDRFVVMNLDHYQLSARERADRCTCGKSGRHGRGRMCRRVDADPSAARGRTAASDALAYTAQYNLRAARFLKRHPQLREPWRKTLLLLKTHPHHRSLRLHASGGKLEGLHSTSINSSHRITLELLIRIKQIVQINVGGDGAVYCVLARFCTSGKRGRQRDGFSNRT